MKRCILIHVSFLLTLLSLPLPQGRLMGQTIGTEAWYQALAQKESKTLRDLWRLNTDDCDPVLEFLSRQSEQYPWDPDWPYYLGVVYERAQLFDLAALQYTRTNDLRPSPTIQMQIAHCQDALSRWDLAIDQMNLLVAEDSTDITKGLILAEYQYKNACPKAALATLERLLGSNPEGCAELYHKMGLCQEALADDEAARACFLQAVKVDPQYIPSLFSYGRSLMRSGSEQHGRTIIRSSVHLIKESPAYFEDPLLLLHSGERQEAEQKATARLLRSIATERNVGEAYYTLTRLYAQLGFPKRASYNLEQAFNAGFTNFYRILHDHELDPLRKDSFFQSTLRRFWPECLTDLAPFDPVPEGELVHAKFQGVDPHQFSMWVNQKLVYPDDCRTMGLQGKVVIFFYIDSDGKLVEPEILDSPHPDFSKEALRVLKSSPKWTPATFNGKPTKCSYIFPIYFFLRERP